MRKVWAWVFCVCVPWVAQAQQAVAERDDAPTFTRQEWQAFLVATGKAEAIQDPLKRCLAYPDPPGSHWSRKAVEEYCQYLQLPLPDWEQMQSWVAAGQAKKIDQAIDALRRTPVAKKYRADPVWRFLVEYFNQPRPGTERLLADWIRQQPRSSLAYAASGHYDGALAFAARGGQWAKDTPEKNFVAMAHWLMLAKQDLDRAVELNPNNVDAYVDMIQIAKNDGRLEPYGREAMTRALAAAPANLPLYSAIMAWKGPRWGGSPAEQRALIDEALKSVHINPLLVALKAAAMSDDAQLDICDCATANERAQYRVAFDDIAQSVDLRSAGHNAFVNEQYDLAIIYLSEYIRFKPSDASAGQELEQAIGTLMQASASIQP
jgi:hypothetical protein